MVPNGWRLIALENIADPSAAIRYGVVQIGEHTENGIPIVPIKFIKSIDTAKLHRVSASIEAKYKNSRIHAGDVLISVKGTIGAVGIVPEGFSGNIAREIARIRPSVKYDSNYIAFQLQADHTQREIENLTVGTTRKEFSIHTLKKFEILVPPLNEQQKIVKILSTWEQAISATEKLLENSQQQKKALMQQLLTGKKRLLDENGVRFSGVWKHIKLRSLIKEIKRDKEENPNNIELLTVKLHNKGAVASGKFPNSTEGGRPYYKRFAGELIIGRQNLHNGGVAIVPSECNGLIASNAISSFEALNDCDINFILSIMSTSHFRYLIDNLTGGTGQKEVSVRELLNVFVLIPSVEEQQKIAKVLTIADQEIETLQKKLDCLKQEKKALMQQLLTGKKRVKVAA
ncbi:restriction endonuclease subunit S [Acinetobacter baumannii]|uniref:restriction endonuclease subunit S n=1 Tax=Acinetobacter baumannii TaxID=470 RepID=UPI00201D2833|nr:restriction endonuclease subunit S [Acinetobacter baumannii]MCL6695014.1 restriction endonuclease subunit S [Acinetobacter baumannii]